MLQFDWFVAWFDWFFQVTSTSSFSTLIYLWRTYSVLLYQCRLHWRRLLLVVSEKRKFHWADGSGPASCFPCGFSFFRPIELKEKWRGNSTSSSFQRRRIFKPRSNCEMRRRRRGNRSRRWMRWKRKRRKRRKRKSAQTPPGIVKGKVPPPVPNCPVGLQSSPVTNGTTASSTSGSSLPASATCTNRYSNLLISQLFLFQSFFSLGFHANVSVSYPRGLSTFNRLTSGGNGWNQVGDGPNPILSVHSSVVHCRMNATNKQTNKQTKMIKNPKMILRHFVPCLSGFRDFRTLLLPNRSLSTKPAYRTGLSLRVAVHSTAGHSFHNRPLDGTALPLPPSSPLFTSAQLSSAHPARRHFPPSFLSIFNAGCI